MKESLPIRVMNKEKIEKTYANVYERIKFKVKREKSRGFRLVFNPKKVRWLSPRAPRKQSFYY